MFEKPYTNEVKRCAWCGYPIIYNEVADPKSNREDPSYYHIACYNHMEENREANKQPSRLPSGYT